MSERPSIQAEEHFEKVCSQASALIRREQRASVSFVQRHLKLGYNYAFDVIEELERRGVVSAPNHVGRREVLPEVRS